MNKMNNISIRLSKWMVVPMLLATAVITSAAAALAAGNVERVSLAVAEQRIEDVVQRLWSDNAQALSGAARGVYVEGVGVVLTVEVNLATAQISLMHPSLTDKEKAELHQKKVSRLPQLKAALKDALIQSVQDFDAVPATEKMMIAVILPRYSWEDPAGLPMQVTVQATKQEILDGGAKIQTSQF